MNNLQEKVIIAEALGKVYQQYRNPAERLKSLLLRHKNPAREFVALKDVSFTVHKGETIGIIGRNGSGKSTLLQMLAGTLNPTSGRRVVNGRLSALLELGAGFNPEFTGLENIYLNGSILGLAESEIKQRVDSIIDFSGIGAFIHQPVKTYSSGMFVRLAFSIAISVEPEILIVDEALAVGDEAFQRKCYGRLENFQARGGTLVFVSHSAQAVVEICDRALLIDSGELVLDGPAKQVVEFYQRLIYAPLERQQEMKAEVRHQTPETSFLPSGLGLRQQTKEVTTKIKEVFEEGLKSENVVNYDSHGARIENPRLLTMQGEQVNVLAQNGRYIYEYDVSFEEAAQNVSFGMLVKNMAGLPLGGADAAGDLRKLESVAKGSTLQVRFLFDCRLLPGTYFLNCGCMAFSNGEYIYLHRILDAVMFRVSADPESIATGMTDFNINMKIKNFVKDIQE